MTPMTEQDVLVVQAKSRRSGHIAVALVCLTVLIAFSVMIFDRFDKNNQISAIRSELRATQALISATKTTDDEREACIARFTTVTSVRLADYLTDIGDLVIAISTIVPGEEREKAVASTVATMATDLTRYRDVTKLRETWDDNGSPLPCPEIPGT